jgi:hypothetical protein
MDFKTNYLLMIFMVELKKLNASYKVVENMGGVSISPCISYSLNLSGHIK